MPSSPGHASACARNAARSNRPSVGKCQHPGRRAAIADADRQRPRIHPGQTGDPLRPQPRIQVLHCPPVRRLRDVLLHHEAARGDGGGLDILGVGADIADMGKGERDDLPGIGRIGQRLLVAGHAGVEADLAHRRRRVRMGAEPATPEDRTVGQHERGRGTLRHLVRIGVGRRIGVGGGRPPTGPTASEPVAVITAAQWREGMDPAWRHFRTASVPTPVRRAAASAPPSRSMIDSTLAVMAGNLWEVTSQRNRSARRWEFFSGKPTSAQLRIL